MADLKAHLGANLAQAEFLGQTDRAKALKARLAELERPDKPVDKMNKAELLAEAAATGVKVDESMTKAEILEALEGEQ